MTGPVAFRASLRTLSLAALLALPLFSGGACSTAQGTTPDCTPDTTLEGIQPQKDGCSGFAVCRDESGNEADPATVCCKGIENDRARQNCLFGYGAGPAPSGSSSASSSSDASSSASSSSSGTGGGAGGAGGGGGAGGK